MKKRLYLAEWPAPLRRTVGIVMGLPIVVVLGILKEAGLVALEILGEIPYMVRVLWTGKP